MGRTTALVTEATAEIARFDGESLGSTTSFAPLLLRSEAASSSQIENLTSTAKAIAMAELGRRGRQDADEIVANVSATTRALQPADHIDGDAIRRDRVWQATAVLEAMDDFAARAHRGVHRGPDRLRQPTRGQPSGGMFVLTWKMFAGS